MAFLASVRKRPGMYIGETDDTGATDMVLEDRFVRNGPPAPRSS